MRFHLVCLSTCLLVPAAIAPAETARAEVVTARDVPIVRSSQRASDLLAQTDAEPEVTPDDSETADSSAAHSETDAAGEPGRDRLSLGIQRGGFTLGLGSRLREPTVLNGPSRIEVVDAASVRVSIASITGHLSQQLSSNDYLLLEGRGDPALVGLDLSYVNELGSSSGEIAINLFNQRSQIPAFQAGDRDVDLAGSDTPFVHRLGGGVEYFHAFSPKLGVAVGALYEVVSTRPDLFTSDIATEDELGNPLAFSDDGLDQLLALKAAMFFDSVDDSSFPTRGTAIRAGLEQSIPVGDSAVESTRISGSVTQFVPLKLFGFSQGPRVLVANLQAGTIFGDVAPYNAFTLGGTRTVRGYEIGELGTGSSFIQATIEYRFPIANLKLFSRDTNLGGTLFFDYGSDLGTDNKVLGNPAAAREKEGSGFGYGIGVFARFGFGRVRIEFGFNGDGGSTVHFAFGDRF
ncbi:outer membrane protein/protective antigen OMA87 [Rubidibacter lacunae KORDI 51-2]|uniref:Outer membrane protein/protective antigen OMA87 n=1 Tax=Rubidibacter lacunae KORDI 51-2 TaxID=582515 RepID=U5DT26_9CHRO|nr:BamA/TamA family outer membrane protein [Rubidibacter lacunae]ERN42840.1 outer membrane protein/protective antigen OMA87 [Rubidibacter lacunae KORDI 51-2]